MLTSPCRPTTALALVLLAAPAFTQDLTLVYKETGGDGGTSSRYFTKEKMRTSDSARDTIIEYASGKITTIDHKKKEYYEVSLAEMEAQMKAASAEMEKASADMKKQMESMPPAMREQMQKMMGGVAANTTVTKGGTRKVAGYDCQEYTIAMRPMKSETCNTTALKFPVPDMEMKRFEGMSGAFAGLAASPAAQSLGPLMEKMKEVQGFALAEKTTVSILGKNTTSSREAVEVKQGPIDPSVFALPAGYKQVKAPGMKGK
jgi:hypothetical protein